MPQDKLSVLRDVTRVYPCIAMHLKPTYTWVFIELISSPAVVVAISNPDTLLLAARARFNEKVQPETLEFALRVPVMEQQKHIGLLHPIKASPDF